MVTGKQGNPRMAVASPTVSKLPVRTTIAAGAQAQRYVRVTNADHRGYVEFQFSIGDPALFLDMTLPPAAFAEFCATHRARHLSAAVAAMVDASEARWCDGTGIPE